MSIHFQLSDSDTDRDYVFRVLSSPVTLPGEGKKTSWVTITRTGSFTDPRYGRFEITPNMLLSMVKNFDEGVVGQEIFLDVSHKPGDGAAAKILKLRVEGARLRALVEWTEYGLDSVRKRGFRYLSAEFSDDWQDNEAGAFHGPTLLGAGLTTRPVVKNLDPITLSCEAGGNVLILAELANDLLKNARANMNALEKLKELLSKGGFSKPVSDHVMQLAEATFVDGMPTENIDKLLSGLVETAKKLSIINKTEHTDQSAITQGKTVSTVEDNNSPLSKQDVEKVVSKILSELSETEQKKKQAHTAAVKQLSSVIIEAKGLSDEVKKELTASALKLLPENATDEQIKILAEHQIKHGEAVMAAKKLTEMGYAPNGSPRVSIQNDSVKQLSEFYTDNLKKSDYADKLVLKKSDSAFANKVLSEFDKSFATELANEHKMLASGDTSIVNTKLPYGVVREVLRESLHDLNVLSLVQTLTDFNAKQTTEIPYEVRQNQQIINEGIVYEGQPIQSAGVEQRMDMAYINQMKLALSVTNEVIHFTRTSSINWDALARNIETNARIMRELIALRIINQIQRASDSFGAIKVDSEAVTVDVNNGVFRTVNWPVVRPYQAMNLQGVPIGAAENPITITVSGNVIKPYDGSGDQADGTYYRIVNLNFGQFQLVSKNGDPVQGTSDAVIGYSYATNIIKFNLDAPAGIEYEKYLNELLRKVGARKAMMTGQRYENPNFMLMSPVLNDVISNAEEFIQLLRRNGTNTNARGDLGEIKRVPVYGTNAPHTDMGDSRIIMGVSGTTTYTVAKPFSVGELHEVLNGKGQPVGKKVAYGEEYNAIHTPLPICNRYTSIIVYSAAALQGV